MVQPVASIWNLSDPGIAKMADAAVPLRIGGPTVGAVHQQHWALNLAPQGFHLSRANVGNGPDVEIMIELPAPGSILIAVHAVHRQVMRLLFGQMSILSAHPIQCVVNRGIASGHPASRGALGLDPAPPSFRRGNRRALSLELRRRPK